MSLKLINNKNLIFIDSVDMLNEINFKKENKIIITFIGKNKEKENIYNFYDLLDKEIHIKYEDLSTNISEEFHDSLKINLALKKNLTRIFYGQIGLFPYFSLLNKLLLNKNKFTVHTRNEKIFNIFKIFSKLEQVNIFYKKNNKKSNYFKISNFDLFKMYSYNEIFFYFKKKFLKDFKKLSNLKQEVFIHLSSELNFISLDKFLNKNFQTKLFELDEKILDVDLDMNQKEFNEIFNLTNNLIKKYFDENIYFLKYLDFELNNFLKKYTFFYKKVSSIFNELDSSFYFLTKIIRGPLATALYDYGKIKKKKFTWVSHQHGHGIELSNIHKKTQLTKEETLSDLFFVYSSVGKEERMKNKYIKENVKIIDIGYHASNYSFKSVPHHDIIYVSNLNQELTGHEINMSNLSNSKKINFEEGLIKNVFSKINHKVMFKEYPGVKNTDIKSNYIKNLIKPYENIIYFDKWLNAENIYSKSSIILTSLPTSGLGGAIHSKKPLIFIDIKEMMPLKSNLIGNFKEYFFYYDFNDEIFENLKKLLSLDIKMIQNKWENKNSDEKKKFISKYINIKSKKDVANSIKSKLINLN